MADNECWSRSLVFSVLNTGEALECQWLAPQLSHMAVCVKSCWLNKCECEFAVSKGWDRMRDGRRILVVVINLTHNEIINCEVILN